MANVFGAVIKFVKQETFGGMFLFFCAVLAMIVANSSLGDLYFELWEEKLGFQIGESFIGFSLELWINDVLMSFFFLMVGLEIKRELLFGELSGVKKAAFPAIGAVGGMIVPAMIYLAFNVGTDTVHGFGIPMATDIAFALGVVLLLGKRVPPALKVFLVTLAVVDDLGAIVVIAVFYSSGIQAMWLLASGLIVGFLFLLNRAGVRSLVPYLLLGVVLWVFVHESGIHATIAAVVLAFCIPSGAKIQSGVFAERVQKALSYFENEDQKREGGLLLSSQVHQVEDLIKDCKGVQNPSLRLEHLLHPWSGYLIMPLFAFANAGVKVGGGIDFSASSHIVYGVALGLIVGKPVGVLLLTFLCERIGVASRPEGLSWGSIFGTGLLAGIGFTMSMFVTNLAFSTDIHVEVAKITILLSSSLAGILGSIYLLWLSKK